MLCARKIGDPVTIQLDHFADASEKGYGAIAYLRFVNSDQRCHCSFVVRNSRPAPIRFVSIPRLGLCAAVVSMKRDRMIDAEIDLPIQETIYWTDSMSELKYNIYTE